MIAVNNHNINFHGVKELTVLFKVHRNDIVAMLRSQAYCNLAIAAVD